MKTAALTAFLVLIGNLAAAEESTISKFFDAHCSMCHNAEKKKGGINLEELRAFNL